MSAPGRARTGGRAATVAAVAAASLAMACGHAFGPEDIEVDDPKEFVRAARALIDDRKADPSRGTYVDDEHLPAALRARMVKPNAFVGSVRYALIYPDHLSLVLVRHTDGEGGARVWAAQGRRHADQPTRYEDIYCFANSRKEPESPENIQ